MIFFCYCLAIGIITIALNIYLLAGYYKIQSIEAQPVLKEQPPLAIIVAVRNEEEDLEKALKSVCNLRYDNYRIVVVNDRSTDRTAEILDNLKIQYPRIRIVTLISLPDGWLGKNNALYQGYLNSKEEWMLFTDADIEFHPDALSKAMSYAVSQRLDHLAVLPHVVSRSAILNSVFATFSIMLMIHLKPWNARNPRSKGYVGVGAFNLVRRDAYEKIGTHVCIKLRPDDDLQLGQQIKLAGLRQDVLTGKDYVCLEWYKNLSQFCNGLLKNSFSTAEYKFARTIFDVILMLLSVALPMPLMFVFGSEPIRLLACGVLLSSLAYMILVFPNKWWYAFMIPFSGFFMAYSFLRAAIVNIRQGGIYWRGSFYSLAELREKN
ncbi:MAG: glycosyltransferase [Mucilaginibacter sp.]|jgi:cellulose synthase/poly-beta-1,6-N-acetylglucosamine synthase-like glycosyltransferase